MSGVQKRRRKPQDAHEQNVAGQTQLRGSSPGRNAAYTSSGEAALYWLFAQGHQTSKYSGWRAQKAGDSKQNQTYRLRPLHPIHEGRQPAARSFERLRACFAWLLPSRRQRILRKLKL